MATVIQIESHEAVTWFQYSQQYSRICLSTGVRLNVCIFSSEQLTCTIDGKLLNLVYYLTTTIVTMARIALSILVSAIGAHSFHYLITYEVF